MTILRMAEGRELAGETCRSDQSFSYHDQVLTTLAMQQMCVVPDIC